MFLDLTSIETKSKSDFDPLPPGEYEVKVAQASLKDNAANTENFLLLDFVILSPENYQGRHIFQTLGITSTNEQRKQIALEQIKAMLQNAGWKTPVVKTIGELELVHVNVVTKNREYNGKIYTDVRYFKPAKALGTPMPKQEFDVIPF
jgi:hypothetical protein